LNKASHLQVTAVKRCTQTPVIIINVPRSHSVYNIWRSQHWQHVKVIVMCGNVPEFQKWGPRSQI